MKKYHTIMLYKKNKDKSIEKLKSVFDDILIYENIGITAMNVQEHWDKVLHLNIGKPILTMNKIECLIKNIYLNDYQIKDLKLWKQSREDKYINELINLLNTNNVSNHRLRNEMIKLLIKELDYQDNENDNSLKSLKIFKDNNIIVYLLCNSTLEVNELHQSKVNEVLEIIDKSIKQ